jgi:hypothetical protein
MKTDHKKNGPSKQKWENKMQFNKPWEFNQTEQI